MKRRTISKAIIYCQFLSSPFTFDVDNDDSETMTLVQLIKSSIIKYELF